MSSTHYFALPLGQTQQKLPFRASKYLNARKRKRDELEDDIETGVDDDGVHSESGVSSIPSPATRATSYVSLTSERAVQYRAAGFDPDDELPSYPFPHAPPSESRAHFSRTKLQQELAELNPPLYLAAENPTRQHPDQPRSSFQRKHLGVMIAVMHRCLLSGDYERAGRAWGMVIRSEMDGRPIDVRQNGYWGIGAEILLRTKSNATSESAQVSVSSDIKAIFSPEGFRAAREYYDFLAGLYGTKKHRMQNELFYLAMFSLWIYEVTQNARVARLQLDESSKSPSLDESLDDTSLAETHSSSEGTFSDNKNNEKDKRRRLDRIRLEELEGAKEIASRWDKLLATTFDSALLQLRGMIALWIGDLDTHGNIAVGKDQQADESEEELDEDESEEGADEDESEAEDDEDNNSREEQDGGAEYFLNISPQKGRNGPETPQEQAKDWFVQAVKRGGRLWEGIAHLVDPEDVESDRD